MTTMHGHVSAVTREIHGDELTAAVGVADETLTVIDTADFDEDGGWLRVGGEDGWLAEYASIDDETATIQLVEPAPETADEGDRVDVWDPDDGDVVSEHVADVVDDTTGDIVHATVDHALIDRLTNSVRGGVGESVICEEDSDGLWTLVQILGKEPVIDGTYLDPTTVPTGNSVTRSTAPPTGPPTQDGDVYYQYEGAGVVIGWWIGDGGVWVPQEVAGVMLTVDALDGKEITGALIRTALNGERWELNTDGVNRFTAYTGEVDEVAGAIEVDYVTDGTDRHFYLKAFPPAFTGQPVSGTGAPARLNLFNTKNISGGTYQAVASFIADLLSLSGRAVIDGTLQVNGLVAATMGTGSVGTGTFRTSVDARVTAVAPAAAFAAAEYWHVASTSDATPTSTTNVTIPGMSQAITAVAGAVYRVDLDFDQQITTAGATNIGELLVDGVQTGPVVVLLGPANARSNNHRTIFVTGLAAGTRTFTARTRSGAAATTTAVRVGSTLTIQRVK